MDSGTFIVSLPATYWILFLRTAMYLAILSNFIFLHEYYRDGASNRRRESGSLHKDVIDVWRLSQVELEYIPTGHKNANPCEYTALSQPPLGTNRSVVYSDMSPKSVHVQCGAIPDFEDPALLENIPKYISLRMNCCSSFADNNPSRDMTAKLMDAINCVQRRTTSAVRIGALLGNAEDCMELGLRSGSCLILLFATLH